MVKMDIFARDNSFNYTITIDYLILSPCFVYAFWQFVINSVGEKAAGKKEKGPKETTV